MRKSPEEYKQKAQNSLEKIFSSYITIKYCYEHRDKPVDDDGITAICEELRERLGLDFNTLLKHELDCIDLYRMELENAARNYNWACCGDDEYFGPYNSESFYDALYDVHLRVDKMQSDKFNAPFDAFVHDIAKLYAEAAKCTYIVSVDMMPVLFRHFSHKA